MREPGARFVGYDRRVDGLAQVVRCIAAGDRSAEAELCRSLRGAIRIFALRRVPASDVDDFVQEVLLALLAAARQGRIGEPERAGGYALAVCRRMAADRVRTHARREELLLRYGAELAPETMPAAIQVPLWMVEECVIRLTPSARAVVRMTFLEERSTSEIADELALAPGNVRVMRHRALRALLECLRAHGATGEEQ
jgi:RNA polymerase sigma-70 factor (ECF subfamily)